MDPSSPIVECVPNFSEGRNPQTIETIAGAFRDKAGLKLLDVQTDGSHNRTVVTVAGEPERVAEAVVDACAVAVAAIDMRRHRGQHPRMGAVDVVPFIPLRHMSMDDAVRLSRSLGKRLAERFQIPVFLYERSASAAHRVNLADIRRGEFEGMAEKIRLPEWKPDFGPVEVHPSAGVTAVGARMPLVAFNVCLGTADVAVARAVARRVRHTGGGLRYCKAIGIALPERGVVQVSMNLTDTTQTAVYRALEMVRVEARRFGVPVLGSEIVGLVPMAALVESAAYYLGLETFGMDQILEARLMGI